MRTTPTKVMEIFLDLPILSTVLEDPEGQVAQGIQQLQKYKFQIQHRKGTSYWNADRLSQRFRDLECEQCRRMEKNYVIHVQKLMLRARMEPDQIKEVRLSGIVAQSKETRMLYGPLE